MADTSHSLLFLSQREVIEAGVLNMDQVVPLMEKFNRQYGRYPEYPVADAGYGSLNNYLYCEEHNMKKYMK